MDTESNYIQLLDKLKQEIKTARIKAHLAVNAELTVLYWKIGKHILERQKDEGWGTKVIERLSRDLHCEFPEMKGLSSRNLVYMQTFAKAYPDFEFTQEVLAKITWYHNITLLDKIRDNKERIWYIHKTIENGWSRNVLVHQIETNLYTRQGKSLTNFSHTLPEEQSDLAQEIFKSSYNLEFLTLEQKAKERDLERSLVSNIRDFLLELGTGFAFMGSQYKITVEEEDFFIDLLFYHVRLRAYVVIEIKTGKFIPEYAGKVGFYLAAIDHQVKRPDDNPSIGLILCQLNKKLIVEYALKGSTKPIGVSGYNITENLPEELKEELPSATEIQKYLNQHIEDQATEQLPNLKLISK
jgi:predicted nuclease of restriction endonuclease-like (RecB) superfamily